MTLMLVYTLLFSAIVPSSFEYKECVDLVCASVVSKCMLTQACKCEINKAQNKCDCCSDCVKCLAEDYFQCCSCLDMCNSPSQNEKEESNRLESQLGDFASPFEQLFEALTIGGEISSKAIIKGKVVKYPADDAIDKIHNRIQKNKKQDSVDPYLFSPNLPRLGVDCTVVFLEDCVNALKCSQTCNSIGASKYRFFFDGCCQCIGSTCLDYGINDSRCTGCSYLSEFDGTLLMGDYDNNDNDEKN